MQTSTRQRTDPKEHAVQFKVMRLGRPTFDEVVGVGWEPSDFPGQAPSGVLPDIACGALFHTVTYSTAVHPHDDDFESPDGFGLLDIMSLPHSFGTIYVGETFSSYVSLSNVSSQVLSNLNVKVEIQTASQRIILFDRELRDESLSTVPSPTFYFHPGRNADIVVDYELKELGGHILVCSATYTDAEGKPEFLRQFFKFQVLSPLIVTSRVTLMQDTIFVETQVSNNMLGPISFEGIHFEPIPQYQLQQQGEFSALSAVVPGDVPFMRPGDSRQFIHMLLPVLPPGISTPRTDGPVTLGRMDMSWRSRFGDIGRLSGIPVSWKPPVPQDLELMVVGWPSRIVVEAPFAVGMRLTNNTDRVVVARLLIVPDDPPAIVVNGLSGQSVGPVPARSAMTFEVNLFPLEVGVHRLPQLQLASADGERVLSFDKLGEVIVEQQASDMINSIPEGVVIVGFG